MQGMSHRESLVTSADHQPRGPKRRGLANRGALSEEPHLHSP